MVICDRCDSGELRAVSQDGERYYRCENADDYEAGEGCNIYIPADKVR